LAQSGGILRAGRPLENLLHVAEELANVLFREPLSDLLVHRLLLGLLLGLLPHRALTHLLLA
jgi:hypothetical protein